MFHYTWIHHFCLITSIIVHKTGCSDVCCVTYIQVYDGVVLCRVLMRASVEQPDTVMQHKQFAAK